MKKITTLITIMVLCLASVFAQAPEKFNYQAVVRNASNQLMSNASVGVRVSILQGSSSGSAVYVETQTVTTNANGLMTVEIGGGNAQQGTFANIDWSDGPYFLKVETDPNGGSNYSVTSSQQLLSVPYAQYAEEAGNVPSNVSAFVNDAGYTTNAALQQIIDALNARIDSLENLVNNPNPASFDTVDAHPCLGVPTVTDYDGNVYNTVQIGQQCWMKTNLRTKHFRSGLLINSSTESSYVQPLYYQPSNGEVAEYDEVNNGLYYNWSAVNDLNGICPEGWHVPSYDDFYQLYDYTRNQSEYFCSSSEPNNYGGVGKALSSTIGWYNDTSSCAVGNNPALNNATGFSAFPAGYWYDSSIGTSIHYTYLGRYSFFWTSTLTDNDQVWYYYIAYNDSNIYGQNPPLTGVYPDFNTNYSFSVRCLKD